MQFCFHEHEKSQLFDHFFLELTCFENTFDLSFPQPIKEKSIVCEGSFLLGFRDQKNRVSRVFDKSSPLILIQKGLKVVIAKLLDIIFAYI